MFWCLELLVIPFSVPPFFFDSCRFIIFILAEHVLLTIRSIVDYFIPEIPDSVARAMVWKDVLSDLLRTEKFHEEMVCSTAATIDSQRFEEIPLPPLVVPHLWYFQNHKQVELVEHDSEDEDEGLDNEVGDPHTENFNNLLSNGKLSSLEMKEVKIKKRFPEESVDDGEPMASFK